jgi:hypothetical protein
MRRANGAFDFDLRFLNDDKGRSERLAVWENASGNEKAAFCAQGNKCRQP